MSIPYLILLSNLLFLWPAMLTVVHLSAYDWQEKQIAVDNAATVIGQTDRTLFNAIITYNKVVRGIEIGHDIAHECKENDPEPFTRAMCAATDAGLEMSLMLKKIAIQGVIRSMWLSAKTRALFELGKLGVVGASIQRSNSAPVHFERCSICRLETLIEVDKAPVKTLISTRASNVPIKVLTEVGGRSLTSDRKWNYKLKTGEEEW